MHRRPRRSARQAAPPMSSIAVTGSGMTEADSGSARSIADRGEPLLPDEPRILAAPDT